MRALFFVAPLSRERRATRAQCIRIARTARRSSRGAAQNRQRNTTAAQRMQKRLRVLGASPGIAGALSLVAFMHRGPYARTRVDDYAVHRFGIRLMC